jgi:hypothetical protein
MDNATDQLPPFSAEAKEEWRSITNPPICLYGMVLIKYEGQFYLYSVKVSSHKLKQGKVC